MSSFRSFASGSGGSFGGDSISLTVPLNPHGPYGAGAGSTGTPGSASAAGTATSSGPNPAEVRLAGVDTKEKMYEPKQRKKLVRVLTVVAYLFFVSLAAAMLSLYYVFIWNPTPRDTKHHHHHGSSTSRRAEEDKLLLVELQREQQRLRLQRLETLEAQVELAGWSTSLPPDYADVTDLGDDGPFTEGPLEDGLAAGGRRHGDYHDKGLAEDNDIPEPDSDLIPDPERAGAATSALHSLRHWDRSRKLRNSGSQ